MRKKYIERIERWKTLKALECLGNFLRNHQGDVNDNDIFVPVVDFLDESDWMKKIKEIFPASTIKRMEKQHCHNRLDFDDHPTEILRCVWNTKFAREKIRSFLVNEIRQSLQDMPLENFTAETFPRQLGEMQRTFGLSDFECEVMTVFAFIANDTLIVVDGHNRRSDENDRAVFAAKCLNCEINNVMAALDCKKKLRRYNCINSDFEFNHRLFEFLNGVSDEPLSSNYFKLCKDETLPWDFYGSLADRHGEMIKNILRSSKNGPSNILLYGAPGTGKTSFARTIADQLGKKCYLIAQNLKTREQANSSPEFRFAALQICDSQVDPDNSLIVVDEADEMLQGLYNMGGMPFFMGGMEMNVGDKGLLNDVLDNIKTPTVWITNTPAEALDESSRRRFDYSVCFAPLSALQRRSIWKNNIRKMHMESLIDDNMAAFFADRYNVNAGIITKVLSNVQKLVTAPGETKAVMEKLMAQHCELLNVQIQEEKLLPARDYSLEGLNIKGDLELEKIVAACRKFQLDEGDSPDRPRMNLLLAGPPGTGKTEYVKYLGQALNTRITVRMGSDLLSMYVGGTEHNIKEAFAQAEQEHAILFLDEIDGLMQSREQARCSWEVTQVNELLYQMENFKGILIGATNFMQNLDAATLRRFTFKIGFDYLDNNGKKLFFERMFKTQLTVAERRKLDAIENLAPGDFRTVRQSFYYLNDEVTNTDRLKALERESEVKKSRGNPACKSGKIGF